MLYMKLREVLLKEERLHKLLKMLKKDTGKKISAKKVKKEINSLSPQDIGRSIDKKSIYEILKKRLANQKD